MGLAHQGKQSIVDVIHSGRIGNNKTGMIMAHNVHHILDDLNTDIGPVCNVIRYLAI